MNEEHLSEAEKKIFRKLENEKDPPKRLEKRIIAQLIMENQIQKNTIMNIYLKWTASLAASVLLFVGGIYYEKSNANKVVKIEPTKGYMLLLHEDANFAPGDPMAMFEEYKSWVENTFAKGVKITGQELKNDAILLNGESQLAFSDKAEKRTTGYFLLEAISYNQAIEVAKENPHIKYGGSIEVKSFMVR